MEESQSNVTRQNFKKSVLSLFIIGIILMGEGWLHTQATAQWVNEPAPEFEVYALGGRGFSNYSLEGDRALLMFWAPWCGVCREELPKLAEYYEGAMPVDLQVLSLGGAASSGQVYGYVQNHSETFVFPTAYDEGQLIGEAFGVRAYPTYVLLDEDGTILLVHRGGGVLDSKRFKRLMR